MTKKPDDFENRFFQLLMEKLDSNTKLTEKTYAQAMKTNSRVDKLETEVFGKIKPSDLPPFYRDPKVVSIIFNISLAILVLIIAATKVDVGNLVP